MEYLGKFKNNKIPVNAWITKQRVNFKNNKLSQERIDLLEQIPKWKWIVMEEQWMEDYEQLKEFITQNNRLPKEKEKGRRFIAHQREKYNKKILSEESIYLLEQLPKWKWNVIEEQWMQDYEQLRQYLIINDKLPNQKEKFGKWVQHQRENYKNNKLSQERIDLLQRLPKWKWNLLESKWTENYNEIKEFINENNKLPIKNNWITNQKSFYKKGKLSQSRIHLLEQLPGWKWSIIEK